MHVIRCTFLHEIWVKLRCDLSFGGTPGSRRSVQPVVQSDFTPDVWQALWHDGQYTVSLVQSLILTNGTRPRLFGWAHNKWVVTSTREQERCRPNKDPLDNATHAASPVKGRPLVPAVGFQGPEQGSRVLLQLVDGTGPGQRPAGRGHPEREVVVWNLQLHGPLEQCCNDWLELPSREELKARAVRSFPDDLFTGLS